VVDKILYQCEPPHYQITKIPLILRSNILIDRTRSPYCGRLGFILESGDNDRYINSISGAATCRQNILTKGVIDWLIDWLIELGYGTKLAPMHLGLSDGMAHPDTSHSPSHTRPRPPCGSLPSTTRSVPGPTRTLHPPSYWLRLFSSQNFSLINTPTFLKPSHSTCPWRWNRVFRNVGYKIQTPGNHPEESIQHSEQGESLKSRILVKV
jgi:hypothetical protein